MCAATIKLFRLIQIMLVITICKKIHACLAAWPLSECKVLGFEKISISNFYRKLYKNNIKPLTYFNLLIKFYFFLNISLKFKKR